VTRHITLLATGSVMVSLMACKLSKKADDEEATPSPSAAASVQPAAPSAPPPASATATAPQGLFADKLPEGLLPVDRSSVPVDTLKKAAKLEDDATKARKAKDYGKAVELYVEALKADPGYPAARYNLARTLILDGKVDAGLGVLDQLHRTPACFVCEGLLLRAAQENDFKNAYDRPEFKERTSPGYTRRASTVCRHW
jgi:tetratricopeptide (TPR) repeat protein